MQMDERAIVVAFVEQARERAEHDDRHHPHADQHRDRAAAERDQHAIAVMDVERPHEPQRHHDEYGDGRPRVRERIADGGERRPVVRNRANARGNGATALQDQHRDHHVRGERDRLLQRDVTGFGEAQVRGELDRGRAGADDDHDPRDRALREGGPRVADVQQPQLMRVGLEEQAAHDRHEPADHVDVDQRAERGLDRRAVVGDERHHEPGDADEHEQRHRAQQEAHDCARHPVQERRVTARVPAPARRRLCRVRCIGRRCVVRPSCVVGARLVVRRRLARRTGTARGQRGERTAQQAAHEPFADERRHEHRDDQPERACEIGARIGAPERVLPPPADRSDLEQRAQRVAQRVADADGPARTLPHEHRGKAVRCQRDGRGRRRRGARRRRCAGRDGRCTECADRGDRAQCRFDLFAFARTLEHRERLARLLRGQGRCGSRCRRRGGGGGGRGGLCGRDEGGEQPAEEQMSHEWHAGAHRHAARRAGRWTEVNMIAIGTE